MNERTRTGFYGLAAVLFVALVVAGCGTEGEPLTEGETGKAQVRLNLPASVGAQTASALPAGWAAGGPSPTVYPDGLDTWTYNIRCEDVDGIRSSVDSSVTVNAEGSGSEVVTLPVGTWTITVTAGPDESTTVATGARTVAIAKDEITTVDITLGPGEEGTGTFAYEVTLATEAAITMTMTDTSGGEIEGGALLSSVTTTQAIGSITVASGEYRVTVATTGASIDGVTEIVHIYQGQTTRFAFESNGVVKTTVTDLDLSGYIAPPSEGGAMTRMFTGSAQYTGYVVWEYQTGDGWKTAPLSGSFEGGGVTYRARVTLIPRGDYTFAGLPENKFTYGGAASVTNNDNEGFVTIVFAKTDWSAPEGYANVVIGFNYGAIDVTGTTEGALTLNLYSEPRSATLAASEDYENVAWFVGSESMATDSSLLVSTKEEDEADYLVQEEARQTITFIGTVAGRTYSQRIPLKVQPGPRDYTVSQTGTALVFEFAEALPADKDLLCENITIINDTGEAALSGEPPSPDAARKNWTVNLTSITGGGVTIAIIGRSDIDPADHPLTLE